MSDEAAAVDAASIVDETGSRGRGRGRGRGGVPLLPTGVWDALNGGSEKMDHPVEQFLSDQSTQRKVADHGGDGDRPFDREDGRYKDAKEVSNNPHAFGFSNFGARGRGGDVRSAGAAKGRSKDSKGADWECHSCTNVNWSWRSTCNKCGVAKIAVIAIDEARDGVGGGFNERQDRASSNTVEVDDDGFDDFGRRVKKSTPSGRQAKADAALKRMQEKYRHLMPSNGADPATLTAPPDISIHHNSTISPTFDWKRPETEKEFHRQIHPTHISDRSQAGEKCRLHSRDSRERRDGADRSRGWERGGGRDKQREYGRDRRQSRSRSRDRR